jgi:hypothetical protein
MNWIAPTMPTRFLTERDLLLEKEFVHGIKPMKSRAVDQESRAAPLLPKLTFSPFGLTELQQSVFESKCYK